MTFKKDEKVQCLSTGLIYHIEYGPYGGKWPQYLVRQELSNFTIYTSLGANGLVKWVSPEEERKEARVRRVARALVKCNHPYTYEQRPHAIDGYVEDYLVDAAEILEAADNEDYE